MKLCGTRARVLLPARIALARQNLLRVMRVSAKAQNASIPQDLVKLGQVDCLVFRLAGTGEAHKRNMRIHNDQLVFGDECQIVLEPIQLALADHAVIGRLRRLRAGRMRIDAVAAIEHIVQNNEVHAADIEGVVFRSPLSTEGVERVGITCCIEVEVVVAGDKVLRDSTYRGDRPQTRIQREIIAHDVSLED